MRLPRIYTAQGLGSGITLSLAPEPSRHIARVLRMGAGDALVLFDGSGGEYPAEILAIGKKRVDVRTGNHRALECESPLHIHLGIAISRGERMDWIVQKSTELGVGAITPLFTEHTGVKLAGERAEKKIQHWRQVAISACEQCGRNRLPAVHHPLPLDDWTESTAAECKFVLHHRAGDSPPGVDRDPSTVAVLVGPEGGLSEEEIAAAERAGFASLRLGPRVLRTETAPLAAIALLQSYWGDM
jgi:16S rRNA (uracil1498-N3)-methyltransferase